MSNRYQSRTFYSGTQRKFSRVFYRAASTASTCCFFCELFSDYIDVINRAHTVPFLTALFDIGELVVPNWCNPSNLAYWFLQKETDEQWYKKTLLKALKNTPGFSIPIYIIANEINNKNNSKRSLLNETDIQAIKERGRNIIQRTLDLNPSSLSHHLSDLLEYWLVIEAEKELIKKRVAQFISSEPGFLCFIKGFVKSKDFRPLEEYATTNIPYFDRVAMENFISFEKIVERIKDLNRESLVPDEKLACKLIMKANQQNKT